MKKILAVLFFFLCYIGVKAQSKILIAYDANGNRILRYYLSQKPAHVQDSSKVLNKLEENIITSNDSMRNGLQSFDNMGFKVYPNPSNDQFNVAIDEAMMKTKCEIMLTDQLGKVYYQKVVKQTVTTISTTHLADGVYYIIVNYGNRRSSVKLVKEASR